MELKTIPEVQHKLTCGQTIFRKELIQKLMDEVSALVNSKEIHIETAVVKPTNYNRPILSAEEKEKYQSYAKNLYYNGGSSVRTITALIFENVSLLREVNEHRAARGIDPLPIFEV